MYMRPQSIKRHKSYSVFYDKEKGWSFRGDGPQSIVDWQSPTMQSAPFELGRVINSIRTGYLPIESLQTKKAWVIGDTGLTDAMHSIYDQELNMDELLDKACFNPPQNNASTVGFHQDHEVEPIHSDDILIKAINKLLIERFQWWVNKHGSVATKPEYMTLKNFVTQAKTFEWFYLYQGWEKPQGRIKTKGSTKDEVLSSLDELIVAGMTKFAPRQRFGLREPLNMQGALYLILEKRYQQIQQGLWDLRRTKHRKMPSWIICENHWGACLSLVPSIAGAKNPQKSCSDYCRKRKAYYISDKGGLQERIDANERRMDIWKRGMHHGA